MMMASARFQNQGVLVFQAGQRESGYGLRQITFGLDKTPGESQGNEKTIGLDIPWFEDYLSREIPDEPGNKTISSL